MKYNKSEIINVGSGKEISIKLLSELICQIIGYKGRVIFDQSFPDGTPRKLLDISKIKAIGWKPTISLKEGLKKTIEWYITNKKTRN